MMPADEGREIVFAVDVTSFTKDGFVASTSFAGNAVNFEFDEANKGVRLNPDMAKKLNARKGTPLLVIVENKGMVVAETQVVAVGKSVGVSDAKVYYAVGREGGAVVRIRHR